MGGWWQRLARTESRLIGQGNLFVANVQGRVFHRSEFHRGCIRIPREFHMSRRGRLIVSLQTNPYTPEFFGHFLITIHRITLESINIRG